MGALLDVYMESKFQQVMSAACVTELRSLFAADPDVIILPVGVAEKIGTLQFYHSDTTVASTFSPEWVNGMYKDKFKWEDGISVEVTTLNALIGAYGMPVFCKIDVEGYEAQVLNGLHYAIPALSFEFHQQNLDQVRACVARLARIGNYEFNFADGETFAMSLPAWVTATELLDILHKIPFPYYRPFWGGDVYARLK